MMRRNLPRSFVPAVFMIVAALAGAAAASAATPVDARQSAGRLKVSDNGHFIVRADGSPFFYLGDTAWELIHRLTREDAEFSEDALNPLR